MHEYSLFWPMLVTLAIPVVVLMLNAIRKAADRKAGNINENQPTDNTAWSLPVVLTSNALANQFQFPIVFYVLCFIVLHLKVVSTFALVIAWAYAVSRCLHAFVHVTSNYIPARFGFFVLSCLFLILFFGFTVGALISRMQALPA